MGMLEQGPRIGVAEGVTPDPELRTQWASAQRNKGVGKRSSEGPCRVPWGETWGAKGSGGYLGSSGKSGFERDVG